MAAFAANTASLSCDKGGRPNTANSVAPMLEHQQRAYEL